MERWIEKKQCAVMIGVHNAPHKPLYRVCKRNPAAHRILASVSSPSAIICGVSSVVRRLNHFRHTVSESWPNIDIPRATKRRLLIPYGSLQSSLIRNSLEIVVYGAIGCSRFDEH
ncbi:hypothetical protein Q1695_001651 [Nippostrongylus brasiliensis]|nr:hypothetical protein Q1695_001651 [Nippostrongylus brasiliensis]